MTKEDKIKKAIEAKNLHDEIYKSKPTYICYTDGSGYWKNKLGGVGVYIEYNTLAGNLLIKKFSTGYHSTTTQRMELRALIKALKFIKIKDKRVVVFTDSEYVLNIALKTKTPLENKDLTSTLYQELNKFKDISLYWVKGHSNIKGNEIADKLANYKQFSDLERIEDARN